VSDCVRGLVKPTGLQLPACASAYFTNKVAELILQSLLPAIEPLLEQLDSLSNAIVEYDEQIDNIDRTERTETERL
jgi:arginase family enzyme